MDQVRDASVGDLEAMAELLEDEARAARMARSAAAAMGAPAPRRARRRG